MSVRMVYSEVSQGSTREDSARLDADLERAAPECLCEAVAANDNIVSLSSLKAGQEGVICHLDAQADAAIAHRLQLLGFDRGREVCLIRQAPMHGPMVFRVCDAQMCLRQAQADMIYVRLADGEIVEQAA